VMPDATNMAPWATLESLPYLSAVIKESLRLAFGMSSRFIRVAPDATLIYKDYVLPPGTAVSMSSMLLCQHPATFDEAGSFIPERWLGKIDPSNIFAFGRGTRMCVGQK
jgi:cytochrome P450